MRPGDRIKVEAPSGTFVFSGTKWPTIVLIGGGVGITPMMSSARYLTETEWPGTIYLLLSFRTRGDFIFEKEIEAMEARNPRLRVAVTMTGAEQAAWQGHTGRIDAGFVTASVPDIALHRAHVCGPTPMMDAVCSILRALGMPPDRIRTEAFGTDRRDPTLQADKTRKVVGTIRFLQSRETAEAREEETLLEVASRAGVPIDSACRSGTCGTCMVRMKSGRVRMAIKEALGEGDEQDGYVLACQAKPDNDVELEL